MSFRRQTASASEETPGRPISTLLWSASPSRPTTMTRTTARGTTPNGGVSLLLWIRLAAHRSPLTEADRMNRNCLGTRTIPITRTETLFPCDCRERR
ncbi:UNVERIFIED_CONTAM: hypothetical protein FKN15_017499 [Acipenser sinensis]